MGMLEQHMKKLPDGKQMHEYIKEMNQRLRDYTEEGCEGYEIYDFRREQL
jgi:cell division protein FtsB